MSVAVSFKRTASTSFAAAADVYDVDIGGAELVETRRDGRYLQLLHLPDAGDPADRDARPRRGGAHEVVVRDAVEVVVVDGTPRPSSTVVDRYGPFERAAALRRAVELARSLDVPVYHEVDTLRPDRWTAAADWVTYPSCGGCRVSLGADLDDGGLSLACRTCGARVGPSERERLFHEWLHCPSCGSGDVDMELSAPHGGVWWSCDDCLYDSHPAPRDRGYSSARA